MIQPAGPFRRLTRPVMLCLFALPTLALLAGCSAGSGSGVQQGGERVFRTRASGRSRGPCVVQLEFLLSYENERNAFYFPIEGLAG